MNKRNRLKTVRSQNEKVARSFRKKQNMRVVYSCMLTINQFLPKYCSVLLSDDYREYVSEIIIEEHTDTNGSYIYNLELSQHRAFSVAKYCLTESNGIISSGQEDQLRIVLTANGKSYSNPVYKKDGTVDMAASRRVEIKFRLQDDEMMDILKDK